MNAPQRYIHQHIDLLPRDVYKASLLDIIFAAERAEISPEDYPLIAVEATGDEYNAGLSAVFEKTIPNPNFDKELEQWKSYCAKRDAEKAAREAEAKAQEVARLARKEWKQQRLAEKQALKDAQEQEQKFFADFLDKSG